MIISQNSNDVYYAYTRGRFWRWDESARVWKESHLLAQKFGKAKAAEKHLTPEAFLTSDEFIPMDDYELPEQMLTALREAKPCKNAPIEPVEEHPTPSAQCSDAATAAGSQTAASPAAPELPTHPVFRSVQTKTRLCPRVPRPPLTLVQTTRQTPCFCRMRRPSSPAIWPALWPQSTPTI